MLTRLVTSAQSRVIAAICTAFALALLACTPSLAAAAATDVKAPRFVPGADWVAYIDVHALTHSTLGKFIIENNQQLGLDLNDLKQVKERFGIDPLTDIRDMSFSGSGDPEQGHFAFIAQTTPAIDELFAQITAAGGDRDAGAEDRAAPDGMPEVESLQIDGQQVYMASDGDEQTYFHVRQGPTSNDRLVVVSMNKEWMARGLKAAGGMGTGDARFKPASGASIFLSVADLDWLDIDENDQPASAIARNAKGLTLNLGELGEDTFINLSLVTASPDDAQNLSDIAQGLLAMGRLAARHEPDMQPLLAPLRSLALTADGAAVSLKFKHNSEGLIDLLKGVADSGVFGAKIGADVDAGTIGIDAHVGSSTSDQNKDSKSKSKTGD